MADGVWQGALRRLSMGAFIEVALQPVQAGGKACR
jgi:hypothetical protein